MVPRKDPFRNFRFRLEFDGIQKAAFSEITGIEFADEPTDYKVGNEQNSRKLSLVELARLPKPGGQTKHKTNRQHAISFVGQVPKDDRYRLI